MIRSPSLSSPWLWCGLSSPGSRWPAESTVRFRAGGASAAGGARCQVSAIVPAVTRLRSRNTRDWPGVIRKHFCSYGGCCIFGFAGFRALLLAELVYGTPVQVG
jgi:hypothetical protein